MVHKKRSLGSRSKHSSSAAAAAEEAASNRASAAAAAVPDGGGSGGGGGGGGEGKDMQSEEEKQQHQQPQPLPEWEVPNYSAIKVECERALTAFRRGNHTKALRLIKDACHRYEKSALAHRCQGTICVKVAGIIDDQNAKARHLKNAIDSARKAVSLSPNSVEFAHFYANLLYETAHEAKEYEEVAQECERALAIENPIDPAKESFADEQKIPTGEARISHMHQELRSLIQKANISSISTWMKNLGTGTGEDNKFRLIPIRRSLEDPMEVRFVQSRRPNEIKKATKTPEERRKEIEVRVAAARLLQQKSESSSPLPLGDGNNKGPAFSSSGGGGANGHKVGERRKHGSNRKNVGLPERKDQVSSFWSSMSFEKKKDLLSISVSDLRTHYSSMKDGLASQILSEALFFGEVNKSWKFWVCCRCGDKYVNGEALMQHVVQEHLGSLMSKTQSVLPPCVDDDWAEMLLSCSWKPLDLGASVGMLEHQQKLEISELSDNFCRDSDKEQEESTDCWTESYSTADAWDAFSGKKSLVDGCNGSLLESRENGKDANNDCLRCDENQGTKVYTLPNSWPLSNDSERAKLLEKICSIIQVLLTHKCLAMSHLRKVIQFTMDEIQVMAPGWPLIGAGLDQSPLCICFLGASQLRKILKFLQEMSHACGMGRYPENIVANDANIQCQVSGLEEKLALTEDGSCLFLDENLLPDENNNGEVNSPRSLPENDVQRSSDSLLSWIYAGPSIGEELGAWSGMREERTKQAIEFIQLLVKEFGHLQSLCDRKFEHLSYEEALQRLEELCIEESKKREHVTEFARCSYESVLRKRREELVECENDVLFGHNRFEMDAIDNVLKEAENMNANQYGYEETYGVVTSHLCDLEAGEDDWKAKDYLHQVDMCVEVAIQRLKEQLSAELNKIDARLLRTVSTMQQLELKLESVSTFNYISILLPLVKSFMRAHLEDLAEKDATEKSDAAREAFLAELALDSKKNVGVGVDTSKPSHEKVKDKKKNKDSRKPKDTKISNFDEQLENAEANSYPAASDGDHGDSQMVTSVPSDDLRRMEEDFQRKIELEAEERKLEETLEYQRRIENEAKQKHLAKQRKISTDATSEHVLEEQDDVSVQPNSSFDRHHKQEPLEPRNGFLNNSEYFGRNEAVGVAAQDNCFGAHQSKHTHTHPPLKIHPGLSNGGIAVADGPPMEQRTGRRGKRRSHPKLPEGRNHGVPSGKENTNAGVSVVDTWQQGQRSSANDGCGKTLRQLHAEEDDDERFQADCDRAIRQSLDTYEAQHKLQLVTNSRTQNASQQADHFITSGQAIGENENAMDALGTGLQNEVGEYNCFLNVIIQSLWHLRKFREEFLSRPTTSHVHVGDPCVVCALYDILNALSKASADAKGETVSPSLLRVALSNLYPESNFFQKGQMNDASEVLSVIFDCLHQSFTSVSGSSDKSDSVENNCLGTWDCANAACIAHSLFGMDIFERMNCYNCGLESRHLKYTSFFHNINASALRTMKEMCADSSFDELLNLVEMNHQLACDTEARGCGKFNHIHHILSTVPHVFTTVLGWQNTRESVDDIKATLAAIASEIDISVLYRGLDPKNMHRLVSVVCYYGQHYHCFAFSQDSEQWIMYDDKMVKVIGTWEDVLAVCGKGHLQPQVLFYEAVN